MIFILFGHYQNLVIMLIILFDHYQNLVIMIIILFDHYHFVLAEGNHGQIILVMVK